MDLMTSRQQRLDQIYKKVSWRLLPFLLLCYFFAYLDRINIGFAKLQMQQELGFNDAIYGMAAGIFFLVMSCLKCQPTCILKKSAPEKPLPAS